MENHIKREPASKIIERTKSVLFELKKLNVVSTKQFLGITKKHKEKKELLAVLLEMGVLRKKIMRKKNDSDLDDRKSFYIYSDKFHVTYDLVKKIIEKDREKQFEMLNAKKFHTIVISTNGRKPATLIPKKVSAPIVFRRDLQKQEPTEMTPIIKNIMVDKKPDPRIGKISETTMSNHVAFLKEIAKRGSFTFKEFNDGLKKKYHISGNIPTILVQMKFLTRNEKTASEKQTTYTYTGKILPEPFVARKTIEINNSYNVESRKHRGLKKSEKEIDFLQKTVTQILEGKKSFIAPYENLPSQEQLTEGFGELLKNQETTEEQIHPIIPRILSLQSSSNVNPPLVIKKRTWRNLWGLLSFKS